MPCDFIAFWLEINLEHFFGVCFGCERIGEMSFVINTFLSLLLPSTGWHHIAIAIAMQLIRFQRKISENHIAIYLLISTTFCELQHNRNASPVATTYVIPFMWVTNIKPETSHRPQWKKNDWQQSRRKETNSELRKVENRLGIQNNCAGINLRPIELCLRHLYCTQYTDTRINAGRLTIT